MCYVSEVGKTKRTLGTASKLNESFHLNFSGRSMLVSFYDSFLWKLGELVRVLERAL